MSFTDQLELHFDQLSKKLFQNLKSNEELVLSLFAEDQDYVRINNSKVRQATHVQQAQIKLIFQCDSRKVSLSNDLSFDLEADFKVMSALLDRARLETKVLPPDPFCSPIENYGNSRNHFSGELPETDKTIETLCKSTEGSDFTGLYASGPMIRANRNSKGQSHWFSTETLFMDYSLYTVNNEGLNKAVKGTFSDSKFDLETFYTQFQTKKNQLSLLKRKNRTLKPGGYRAYLDYGAASELLAMLGWGAFSFTQYKKGQCALAKLADGQEKFSPLMNVTENFKLGIEPQFNSIGELAPENLTLIENGKLKNWLVSTRSGKEFGVASNAADNGFFGEGPRSLEFSGGSLKTDQILQELGTGIYLSNLHYVNWSDNQNARVTGMTRYACFWVESGEIVGPIQDMRFDDSFYRILGSELVNLTAETQLEPSVETYFMRSLGGRRLPGILVNDFKLTL